MMKHQVEIAKLQSQISTGTKLQKPSDDPVNAARQVNLVHEKEQLIQFNRNATIAEQKLQLEESVIADTTNLVQRIKELALTVSNSSTTSSDYPAIITELEHLYQDLISQANTTDHNGNFIFSGSKSQTRPFILTSDADYQGDNNTAAIQVGHNLHIKAGDSGSSVFMNIPQSRSTHHATTGINNSGNSSALVTNSSASNVMADKSLQINFISDSEYTITDPGTNSVLVAGASLSEDNQIDFNGLQIKIAGSAEAGDTLTITPTKTQDIFSTVKEFINLIGTSSDQTVARSSHRQKLDNIMLSLDQAHTHFSNKRADIGNRLSSLDTIKQENEAIEYQLSTMLADISEVDLVSAISRIEQQTFALEALQATINRTSSLSLFNLR